MCAWDSNPGPQDGRRRRNHGAMVGYIFLTDHHFKMLIIGVSEMLIKTFSIKSIIDVV